MTSATSSAGWIVSSAIFPQHWPFWRSNNWRGGYIPRDNELAADAYALDLCRKAGFDSKRCLQCFDILSWYLLDIGDLDGVYSTDEEIELDPDRATNPIGRISIELRLWRARHARSHPSLHERRKILLSRIAEVVSNDRLMAAVKPTSAAPEKHMADIHAAHAY
jgi:hypothetical protein